MPKLQYCKTNRRYHITIPKEMVRRLEWIKGDDLVWVVNHRGKLELWLD